MKRVIFGLTAAMGMVLAVGTQDANAKGGMGKPKASKGHKHSPSGHSHAGLPRVRVQVKPRVIVTRRVPPVVLVPASSAAPLSAGELTRSAWVGYNPTTGLYSVAFDSPGVGGMGILIKSGYTVTALGPTDWNTAVAYLQSVGAPGW